MKGAPKDLQRQCLRTVELETVLKLENYDASNVNLKKSSARSKRLQSGTPSAAIAAYLNNALDAEPPTASFLKSMLIGGGPVNAAVLS